MRGKKSNPEFISKFISECVRQGITTPEGMVEAAKYDIKNIDDKIKEVETLKVVRSKLLDVIATFDTPEVKNEEAKLLPFFTLKYPDICKHLCDNLKGKDHKCIDVDQANMDPDYTFSIKQMLECQILSRHDQYVMQGERFDEYVKFVLREVE